MKTATQTYPRLLPLLTAATVASAVVLFAPRAQAAWEPSAPVELVVPAGTGGGADQMARFIQQMVTKHKLIITLSNLFTTPLATGTKFTWQDITPVQML
ncbi:MAG TPA: tripartite tricarboxylate transporter substrate binding protein, partial [Burkholderiaceae bacterium]